MKLRKQPHIYIYIFFISIILSSFSAIEAKEKYTKNIDTEIVKTLKKVQYWSQTKMNKDSAALYMSKAFDIISQYKDSLQYETHNKIASVLYEEKNYTGALDFYMQALKILDKNKTKSIEVEKKYVDLYQHISNSLYIHNPQQAAKYMHKGLALAEAIYRKDKRYDVNSARAYNYNNLSALYLDNEKLDSAEYYFKKAFRYCKPNNKTMLCHLYNNLGIINGKKNRLDDALKHFNLSLKYNLQSNDSNNIAPIYMNIGKVYFLKKDYPRALQFTQKALAKSKQARNLKIELYSEDAFVEIYQQMNNPLAAYEHLQQAYSLRDSLFNLDNTRESIQAELQYQYQKQKEEAIYQQETKAKQQKNRMIFLSLLIVILLLGILILSLFINIQRNRIHQNILKQESLILHNENLELKNNKLKSELDSKEKELTIHAQYLLNRNDFMSSIIEQINSNQHNKNDKELNQTLKDIESNIKSSVWDEFNLLFQNLHNDFYVHLYEKHQNLTPNEKRLCTFIRLNMSSKDISSITQQSIKSIEIARSRLRAKLELNREDNLSAYLQQF